MDKNVSESAKKAGRVRSLCALATQTMYIT